MLSKLGENYPFRRERSQKTAPIAATNVRNYNIITCLDKPNSQAGRILPSIALPKLRKLGDYVDFPNPKNKVNCDSKIDFNLAPSHPSQVEGKAPVECAARNLMNSSSVPYNFVTNTLNEVPKTINDLRQEQTHVSNRTKQIGTIYDQGRLFAPNFNPEYQTFFKTNQHPFNRNKGMCADIYNRAHTYGPGLKPFRKYK